MIQYNHLGLYENRKIKTREQVAKAYGYISTLKGFQLDWINVFLFFALFVVIILFIVT